MKRFAYLGIGACACLFSACGVTHLPIDDAYYCAGDDAAAKPATQSEQTDAEAQQPAGPTIVYTNVQDTTVTIQVKR